MVRANCQVEGVQTLTSAANILAQLATSNSGGQSARGTQRGHLDRRGDNASKVMRGRGVEAEVCKGGRRIGVLRVEKSGLRRSFWRGRALGGSPLSSGFHLWVTPTVSETTTRILRVETLCLVMKPFSRGVLKLHRQAIRTPSCLRPCAFTSRTTFQPAAPHSIRFLHSTRSTYAAAKATTKSNASKQTKSNVPKPKDMETIAGVPNLLGKEGYAVVRELANAKEPVVLYKSPPQLGFRMAAYLQSLGTFAASEATGAILFPAGQEVGVGNFVLFTLGFTAVMWSVLGMWIAGAPMNVVRSITAVPKREAVPGSSIGRKLVLLRIEYTWIPFLKNKVVEVKPVDLLAKEPIGRFGFAFKQAKQARDAKFNSNFALWLLGPLATGSRKVLDWTKMTVMRQRLITLEFPGGKAKVDFAGTFPKGELAVDALIPCKEDPEKRW
ncbi:hypothetical protein IWZ00DRAFT_280239 [Phyllosticta capitalensis]